MEHTGQMERDEREFAPRLGRMLDAYADVPAPDLVSGGLTTGRRLKRRRQTLWGAAVFTVVAGLTGGDSREIPDSPGVTSPRIGAVTPNEDNTCRRHPDAAGLLRPFRRVCRRGRRGGAAGEGAG